MRKEKEVEKKRAKPLLNLALIAGPSPREALIAGPLAAGGVAHNHDTEGRLAVRDINSSSRLRDSFTR
jgi:hypothetical protein